MTYRPFIARCLLTLVLLLPLASRAADLQATLDRTRVQLGDTVTLNIDIKGAQGNIGSPDLSALRQDFDVLGTSNSRSYSIVNGAASAKFTIGIALRPKHVGQLQIPSLNVAGSQTQPLQLQVSAASQAPAAGGDVFVEASVTPGHGYVGQQLSYVVKLYYAGNLTGGSLDPPQAKGAEIDSLGQGLRYDSQRGGRLYHVVERRYSVIPQQAGVLHIPPLQFQGEEADPNDPNRFFGATTPVAASAPAQEIHVAAAPSDWGTSAWLPARQLSLTMKGLPASGADARVGQPLNLTMDLSATGLPFEALPSLSLPPLDGATVYPDKPVTGDRQDGLWIVGRRQQAFAVIPERAGTLEIPATTLKWWNVQTDKMELATIPARQLTVLPAIGAANVPASAASSVAPAKVVAPSSGAPGETFPWRWIALGSVGLWLLSMIIWWLQRYSRRRPEKLAATEKPASVRQHRLAFLAAARGADTAAQAHTLLAWARAERPGIQSLGQLAQALADASQREAVEQLQQRHYGGTCVGMADGSPGAMDGEQFARLFGRGFVWRKAGNDDDKDQLAPLYPFKLR